MFRKVLDTERLKKETPNLIGKYVVVGRSESLDDDWVWVMILGSYRETRILKTEVSEEIYKDAFGTPWE